MKTSDIVAAKSADAVLDALHDGAMAQALDALAGVLARNEARRLLPELKAERKRRAEALPALRRDIEDAQANAAALHTAMLEAERELAALPDGIWQGLTHEQIAARDHWLDQSHKRRKAWMAARHSPEHAARRVENARDALAALDGKIAALEAMDVDAMTLGELGKALA